MGRIPAIRLAVLVVATTLGLAVGAAPASATTVTITSPSAGLTNQSSGTFDFTVDTPGVSTTCTLDDIGPTPCASGDPYGPLGDTPVPHTLTVTADDGTNKVSATRKWTVDTTPPITRLYSSPRDTTTSTSATFKFDSEGGATFTCTLDGGTPASCSSPLTYAGPLSLGAHHFEVYATDAAGNADPTPFTRDWTITEPALGAPQILTGPPSPSQNTTPGFTFGATDPATASFECRVDGTDADYLPCSSGATFPQGDGPHTFSVRAISGTGARSATATWGFVVDTTPPLTKIDTTTGPIGTTNSADASFAFTSSEAGTFLCSLDNAAAAPCVSPISYRGLGPGPHTFVVTATDAAGNVGGDSRTWTIKGAPHPAIAVSNLNPLTGVPVTFTNISTADSGDQIDASAWDLDGDGNFNDGPGGAVARSFATPGNHTVRLSVHTTRGGNGTAEVTLHVGDRAPVAGFRVSPRRPVARRDIDLISTASDSDTPIAAQSWKVRERGVRLQPDGGAATVRFPRAGTYHVTLSATDSLGVTGSTTKTIKVKEQPVPPWLVDVSGLPRGRGARFTKLRVRAPQGARVYVRCRGRHCRVRRAFRKTVGPSANLLIRSFQTFFWAGSVIEVQVSDPGYLTKYVRLEVRGRNHRPKRFNGCVVPGQRSRRCPK